MLSSPSSNSINGIATGNPFFFNQQVTRIDNVAAFGTNHINNGICFLIN
jgi:hypothetical protein